MSTDVQLGRNPATVVKKKKKKKYLHHTERIYLHGHMKSYTQMLVIPS